MIITYAEYKNLPAYNTLCISICNSFSGKLISDQNEEFLSALRSSISATRILDMFDNLLRLIYPKMPDIVCSRRVLFEDHKYFIRLIFDSVKMQGFIAQEEVFKEFEITLKNMFPDLPISVGVLSDNGRFYHSQFLGEENYQQLFPDVFRDTDAIAVFDEQYVCLSYGRAKMNSEASNSPEIRAIMEKAGIGIEHNMLPADDYFKKMSGSSKSYVLFNF